MSPSPPRCTIFWPTEAPITTTESTALITYMYITPSSVMKPQPPTPPSLPPISNQKDTKKRQKHLNGHTRCITTFEDILHLEVPIIAQDRVESAASSPRRNSTTPNTPPTGEEHPHLASNERTIQTYHTDSRVLIVPHGSRPLPLGWGTRRNSAALKLSLSPATQGPPSLWYTAQP